MKKIGDYVIRDSMGISSTTIGGDRRKIQLFDGRFDTGFRVVKFRVWGLDSEVHATLLTEPEYSGPMMDASNNLQIGWASSPSSGVGPLDDGLVDPDNMIVEDLYIRGYATTSSQPWNFMIVLEKYDISEWEGALALVRNSSQG